MPAPEFGHLRFHAFEHARVAQHDIGEDRREVLERDGRREAMARREVLPGEVEQLHGARFEQLDIEAGLGEGRVVDAVFAAVHRFLADEPLDVGLQLRIVDDVAVMTHAVDEELLAFGKEDRQRVEELAHVQAGRMPTAQVGGGEIEIEVSALDRGLQVNGRHSGGLQGNTAIE